MLAMTQATTLTGQGYFLHHEELHWTPLNISWDSAPGDRRSGGVKPQVGQQLDGQMTDDADSVEVDNCQLAPTDVDQGMIAPHDDCSPCTCHLPRREQRSY